jgi:hypothetical protein
MNLLAIKTVIDIFGAFKKKKLNKENIKESKTSKAAYALATITAASTQVPVTEYDLYMQLAAAIISVILFLKK